MYVNRYNSHTMKKLVADSSSIILLAKCSLVEKLTQVVEFYIPETVFEECAGEKLREKYPDAVGIWKLIEEKRIHVKTLSNKKMEKGEDEAILLFKETKAGIFLSDDGMAIKICKVLKIPFTTSPRVVIDLYRRRVIDIDQAREALNKLEIIGRYSKDIISSALLELIEKRR